MRVVVDEEFNNKIDFLERIRTILGEQEFVIDRGEELQDLADDDNT